jgi:hypothetical protein
MGDPERLHPLVAEATAQVASCQVRLEYWQNLSAAYGSDSVPEELQQRLDKASEDLTHRLGMLRRLREKLHAEAQAEIAPIIETL